MLIEILEGAILLASLASVFYVSRKNSQLEDEMESMQRKSEYISMSSHEVKNLSHEIAAQADLLLGYTTMPPLSDRSIREASNVIMLKDDAKNLHLSAKTLSNFVYEFLEVSRMRNPHSIPVILSKLNYHNAIKDVFRIYKHQYTNKSLNVFYEHCPEMPTYIKTDTIRFKQVLLNLVGNAVKYTEHGYVKISSSINLEAQTYTFTIEDSGIGIPKGTIKKLGRIQVRGENTSDKLGTGLGIMSVYMMINKLNGSLRIESVENKGSVVSFTLPLLELDSAV